MFKKNKSKKNLASSPTSENAKLINKSGSTSPSSKLNGSTIPTSIKSSSITKPSYSSIPIRSSANELNESRSGVTVNALKNSHHAESVVFTEDFRSCATDNMEDFELKSPPKRKMFLSSIGSTWRRQIGGDDGFGSGYDDFESSSGIIVGSIVAFLMYLMAGAVAFCWYYEHWTLVDAMYFTVVTFTTCGYGDIVPQGDNERLFTIFFIIIGILFLGGVFLTLLFDNVFGAYENMIEEAKEKSSKQFVKESIAKVDRSLFINEARSVGTNRTTSSLSSDTSYLGAICSMMPFIFFIMTGVLYMGYLEGWSYITCAYFFVVTATSVGYGDVVPELQQSRLFAVLFIPSSVMVIAELFNRLIAVYLKQKADACEEEFLNRRMTLADFHRMDVDKSGTVTYDEFIKFFLVAMGKVKEEDMDRLKDLYDKFDANGDGDIQIEDLIVIAEKEDKEMTIGNMTDVIKESKC